MIAGLLKQAKELELKSRNDLLQAQILLETAFKELKKLKRRYRKKILITQKFNKQIEANQEAEEEIVIGIVGLLNEKILRFALKV